VNKILKEHKDFAESIGWDDLAEMIMDLEQLIYKTKLTKKETSLYLEILNIYEEIKKELIKSAGEAILNGSGPIQYNYASYWNDEEEDY